MYIKYALYNNFHAETTAPLVNNTADSALILPDPECLEADETKSVHEFMSSGCGCVVHDGRQCSAQFTIDHYLEFRGQCRELTRPELDMALLGQLSAFTFTSEVTVRLPSDSRQKSYTIFWHKGQKVCRKTFLFLHTISAKRFKNLKASFSNNGLCPRMHGNTKRLPANTVSFVDTQRVVQFITTYAEAHAILLPGRIPGYKRSDLQLLPSSTTKRNVWLLYLVSLQSLPSPPRTVAYSSFCIMWRWFLPQILITKPMSDLCWVCQKNSVAIMRAAN